MFGNFKKLAGQGESASLRDGKGLGVELIFQMQTNSSQPLTSSSLSQQHSACPALYQPDNLKYPFGPEL